MLQRENDKSNSQAALTEESSFDLSILEDMDDPEYTRDIISLFLKDTPRQLKEIREGLTAGVSETVYKTAHKLKSSACILQANNLINLLTNMETLAKTGKVNDELTGLLRKSEQEYHQLAQKLNSYLKNK